MRPKPVVFTAGFLDIKGVGKGWKRMVKLDHVVYFTEKAPAMVVEEQAYLGWHAVIGGKHEKWGTQNALMYMQNAYIEWLSVAQEEIAQNSNHQLVEQLLRDLPEGENWGTVCCSVQGIDKFNEEIRDVGYQTSGVLDAERKTTSGDIVKWKMLFIEQEVSDALPLPFFIEWEKDDVNRFKDLREDGVILPGNEKIGVTECLFSVNNPSKVATEWRALLSVGTSEENMIVLPNVIFKFIQNEFGNKRERLIDVVIEHI